MRFWPFGKRGNPDTPNTRKAIPFSGNLDDIAVLKYHGLRALSGALMDVHSACRSPHPFCGEAMQLPLQFIAHAIGQTNAGDGNKLVSIYFTQAVSNPDPTAPEPATALELAASLGYAETKPGRKIVVNFLDDGTYVGQYGSIVNPVEGDYSTGRLDTDDARTLYCDPEPSHAKWQYWDGELTAEQRVVPEYRCVRTATEWLIVDFDRERGLAQSVALLEVTDNPNHNYGIHNNPDAVYALNDDGSEWAKTVKENLYPTI